MSQVEITARMKDNREQLSNIDSLNIEDTAFKWYDEAREKYQWKTWVVAIIEFIGTFLMTFLIVAPSVFGLYDAATYGNSNFGEAIELIFSFMFMRALWVAAGIWVLIILFHKISVNINPAVTIAEMATHNHLRAQGVVKILAQVAGAIAASYAALYMGLALMEDVTSLDSIILGAHNFYIPNPDMDSQLGFAIDSESIKLAEHQLYLLLQFGMEFILTFLLLVAVFATDHVKWSIRSLILGFALLILVSIGIRTDNIALNPARLIGPAMASATYNLNHAGSAIDNGALNALGLILLAELSAAFLMYFIQGAVKTKIENKNTIRTEKQLQLSWAKILTLEVLLSEAKVDKKSLYQMSITSLKVKARKLEVKHYKTLSKTNLIDKITLALVGEYLDSKLKFEEKENIKENQLLAKEIRTSIGINESKDKQISEMQSDLKKASASKKAKLAKKAFKKDQASRMLTVADKDLVKQIELIKSEILKK